MHASGTVSSNGVDRPTEQSLASLSLNRATNGLKPRHGGAVHRYRVQDNAQMLVPRAQRAYWAQVRRAIEIDQAAVGGYEFPGIRNDLA
jgi:hypothetical protein